LASITTSKWSARSRIELQVLVVLVGAERVDAHRDLHLLLARHLRQLAAQQLAAHLLLPAAVLEVEEERVRGGVPAVLAEALRGLLEVLVDAERRRVLDRRIVDLDTRPVVAEDVDRARSGRWPARAGTTALMVGPF
jgi:hypothetical protein